ncbi:hypothetical protein BKA80DRAFT_57455 [Phyllosticta citrichinensis]
MGIFDLFASQSLFFYFSSLCLFLFLASPPISALNPAAISSNAHNHKAWPAHQTDKTSTRLRGVHQPLPSAIQRAHGG